MKKIKSTLIFALFINFLFAQKESNNWRFGIYAGLDFNSGIPVALPAGMINTIEGCSSISDVNGNLLFYTDGISVYDANNNLMPNGDSLKGGSSATQSALIVPYPNSNNLYYIFTVQEQLNNNEFNYSTVDMSLNGGYGDVINKNTFIISPVTEKLTAVKHSNNSDIWVTVHGSGNNNFYSFLVTSAGVSATPVISSVGQFIAVDTISTDFAGQMKFSPSGTKVAFVAAESNYVDLFDFDSATGIVSNEKYLTMPPIGFGAYGLEFSGNGNYLYCSAQLYKIYQWDITSNSEPIINASRQLITTSLNQTLGQLQSAPDGKIYLAKYWGLYLGVINYPNLPAPQCNYIDQGVFMAGNYSLEGLPNFITSYFLSTGIKDNYSNTNLTIFPNPFNSELSFTIQKQNIKQVTFSIKSTLGEIVFFKHENNLNNNYTKTIDLSFLSKGIYLLDVNIDGERTVKKIVKE